MLSPMDRDEHRGLQIRHAMQTAGLTSGALVERLSGKDKTQPKAAPRSVGAAARGEHVKARTLDAIAAVLGCQWWLLSKAEADLIRDLRKAHEIPGTAPRLPKRRKLGARKPNTAKRKTT